MALQGINTVVLNWVKSNHWCLMGLSYFSLGWNTETKKQWAPQLFGPQSKLACCWRNGWWDNNTGQEKRDEKGDVHILCLIHREGRDSSISLSTCHWGVICFGPSRCIGYSTGSLLLDPMLAQSWCGSLKWVNGSDGGCSVITSPLDLSLFIREMQMVGDTCRRNAMNLSQLYWHHILRQKRTLDGPPVYCWHSFGLQQQPSNRTSDHS